MDIIVFVVLLALVFVLFIAAEYLDVVLHVAAFGILFILGLTVMLGQLQYKTGESISQNFTYNPSPLNTSINASSTVRTDIMTQYSGGYSHTIGFLMCALSVLGFVLVYTHYAQKRKEEGE